MGRAQVWPGHVGRRKARGRSEARVQHGAGRHQAGGEVSPQRDHQLACQGHDGDAADAALEVADPLTEPAGQLAAGLMPHPEPAKLDCEGAGTAVAGLADALLAAALATVVRCAGQPEVAAHLAPIVERAVEHLVYPLLAAYPADALPIAP